MGKKFGLNFDGVAELSEKLEQLGGDLKKVAEEALEFIPGDVNPKLHAAMQKHKGHGVTERSIVEGQQVKWTGNVASIDVGFDLKKGGMPSIFLMYGTPRHAPGNQYGGPVRPDAQEHPGIKADTELFNAIYGSKTQKDIAAKQQKIFNQAIQELMK